MLARSLFASACLFFSFQASAQHVDTAWVRAYDAPFGGPDAAQFVAIDGSGNSYVAGTVAANGSDDIAVIKYSPNGTLVWESYYNGPSSGPDVPADLVVDSQGNAIVTGWSQGTTTSADIVTIKYLASGDTAWVRRLDRAHQVDQGTAVAVDKDGNVIVTGYTSISSVTEIVRIKYSPTGSTMHRRRERR